MKKSELFARIEMLERRIATLEARPMYAPSILGPLTTGPIMPTQPFYLPTAPVWPNYPIVTCHSGVSQ